MPNIYFLEATEQASARALCDQHVQQCAVDYPRFLSSAFYYACYACDDSMGELYDRMFRPAVSDLYPKPFEKSHPQVKWLCSNIANYMMLFEMTRHVWEEYKYRYGNVSEQQTHFQKLLSDLPALPSKSSTPSAPVQHMPEAYRCDEKRDGCSNAIIAYRDYYILEISAFARWERGRDAPAWYTERVPDWRTQNGHDEEEEPDEAGFVPVFKGVKRIRAAAPKSRF